MKPAGIAGSNRTLEARREKQSVAKAPDKEAAKPRRKVKRTKAVAGTEAEKDFAFESLHRSKLYDRT